MLVSKIHKFWKSYRWSRCCCDRRGLSHWYTIFMGNFYGMATSNKPRWTRTPLSRNNKWFSCYVNHLP